MINNLLKKTVTTIVMLVVVGLQSCTVHHVHHVKVVKVKKIPPGKAKKISGDKSARRHAHG